MEEKDFIKPDLCHEKALEEMKPSLAFSDNCDFEAYRAKVRKKYIELLGDMPEKVPANVCVEWEKDMGDFIEKRFTFDTEKYAKCLCHLWVPKDGKEKHNVVICLQGHSTGMHISMGRPIYPGDEETCHDGDRDFAVQIIKQGHAALCLEQRAFGERKSDKIDAYTTCNHPAMVALLLGRTFIGERIWDVSRAIDAISEFPELNADNVAVMGNSGGGTTSFYAACFDERISIAMPSCSVCTYKDSIGAMHHCTCNYIPGIAKYFDMGDLASLIAPRPFIIVCGKDDPIFPLHGVRETFETVKKIYKKAGAPENCSLVIGDGGHRFYAKPGWEAFNKYSF